MWKRTGLFRLGLTLTADWQKGRAPCPARNQAASFAPMTCMNKGNQPQTKWAQTVVGEDAQGGLWSQIHRPRIALGLIAVLLLSACASTPKYRPVSDHPVRIGPSYTIRGTSYTPAADPTYDRLGLASWYGSESGSQTANGERFIASWNTAAHTSLPLPSYVEVTALDTGRRIIVRVNDRGPFSGNARILDLSRGAAEELGVRAQGVVPVRVRVVEPSEKDRERLRKGKPAQSLAPIAESTRQALRAQLSAAGY